MGIVLQEALRRLCVEIGWSYAVFWRAIGGPDRKHLVWEDGYCEQTCGLESVYSAMLHQVHALGDGIVGKAALTGKHEWVLGNIINVNGSVMKGSTEMNCQFLAGIQTLAIIPVLSHGVVQLGSTQMVMESIGFINHVKTLFEQLGCIPGALSDITLKASSQQIQAHALLGMQSFFNQLQDVGTDMNSLLDVGCDSSDHLFGYPDSKSVTRPSSSIPRQSNGSSESGRLVDQVIFSSPDGRLIKTISADDSSSGSHFQPHLGLSSTNLTFLERQLLSLPSIGVRESANDSKDASCNIKMLQLGAHGDTSSVSLKHFDTNSLPARNELLTSTNDIGRCSAHQGSESQCAVASSVEMPQVLQQTNNCDSSQKASEPRYPTTIDNSSETVLSVGNQRKDSFLVQTLDGTHAGFYEHGSCYRSLLGELQDSEVHEKYDSLHALNEKSIVSPVRSTTGHDLFDVLGLDYKFGQRSLDDIVAHGNDACTFELNDDVSTCINQLDAGRNIDASNHELSCSGLFSEAGSDQLLDAVVSRVKAGAKPTMDDSVPCKTSLTKICSSSLLSSFPANSWVASLGQRHSEIFGLAPVIVKSETTGSSSVKSTCSIDRSEKAECHKSEVSLWAEKGQNMNCNSTLVAHCKRIDEAGKLNKKRSRPGENPRPRPKDRQMIQDRVKELREIVPNGAKCSIDALLEKTIKHMLFLQSVTKHADKLKETGQPKIITKEGGLLLKDNFEGGATWAFEVGSQSMTCPIVVEDLNPPRQMLVEMLCEERGLFLEIADLIRGLGLTILKGVMEARNNKVWARFAVEANRDVTRMEIFLSLVRLLEPTAGSKKIPEVVDNSNKLHNVFHHPSTIPASGLSDCLW